MSLGIFFTIKITNSFGSGSKLGTPKDSCFILLKRSVVPPVLNFDASPCIQVMKNQPAPGIIIRLSISVEGHKEWVHWMKLVVRSCRPFGNETWQRIQRKWILMGAYFAHLNGYKAVQGEAPHCDVFRLINLSNQLVISTINPSYYV